jgi:hypothetical protein
MTKRLTLAVFLGILVGVTLGYSSIGQQTTAARPALLMQQVGRPNIQPSITHLSNGLSALIIALGAGLLMAVPAFLLAKRRST